MGKNNGVDFTQDSEYKKLVEPLYRDVYNDSMAKAQKDHQINIRVSKDDLDYIDAKARKYGMTRSSLVKYFALNAEFTLSMQEQIRKPEL